MRIVEEITDIMYDNSSIIINRLFECQLVDCY